LLQWFTPAPWKTTNAELDVRPGGSNLIVAFMTAVLTFAPEGDGTRYTARLRHWSESDREAHEEMGFHHGWGAVTDQLIAAILPLGSTADAATG
jgi:uncharacterized protein YndB with AHSA1/START domain